MNYITKENKIYNQSFKLTAMKCGTEMTNSKFGNLLQ